MSFQNYLRRVFRSFEPTGQARRPKSRSRRLELESLEERALPTVVIYPHFGPETVTDHGGTKLNSPPVYLIFWGSDWQGVDSQLAADIQARAATLLSGPYLSGLTQYGSNGLAWLSQVRFDSSNPNQGFSDDQLKAVFNNQIDNNNLPESDDTPFAPIYVVLTPPNVGNAGGAMGYHSTDTDYDFPFDFDHMAYAWVGGFGSDYASQLDSYTGTLSHEVAEAITDSQIDLSWAQGITTVQPGFPSSTNNTEIGDWEPDGNTYVYRVQGVLAQAYWSKNDHAFIVPDGNTQNFYLTPNYDAFNSFLGSYALTVQGGQAAGNPSDAITIDTTSSGGISVTLNGERAQFDPGQISAVTVNAGAGTESINVEHTLAGVPVNIYLSGGTDTVNISPTAQSLGNIQGNVTIYGGTGFGNLNAYDQANPFSSTYAMDGSSLNRTGAATVRYYGLTGTEVFGGTGGNVYDISGTPAYTSTLVTGTGSDTVYVWGTTGGLEVDGSSGFDIVKVGLNPLNGAATLANIQGYVDVYNSSRSGSSQLFVYDTGDAAAHSVGLGNYALTGLAPATIYYQASAAATGGVTYLEVHGGSGNDTFTVNDTRPFYLPTYLYTGSGVDQVNVQATASGLVLVDGGKDTVMIGSAAPSFGGTLANIGGWVDVTGPGATQLSVDDTCDTGAKSPILSNGSLSGLAPATIYWTPTATATGGVTYLGVWGGRGGNTWTVNDTSSFYYDTFLNSGAGNDTVSILGNTGTLYVDGNGGQDSVNVGSGTVAKVNGWVGVYNAGGATQLNVFDNQDTTARSPALYGYYGDGFLDGLAPGRIYWHPTAASTGGVTYLGVYGGSGGNTWTVNDTSNFFSDTYLSSGAGNDQVNVLGTTGTLYVEGAGGQDGVTIGNGTVANVKAFVGVSNASGATALRTDDSADTTGRSVTFYSNFMDGLAPGRIYWTPPASPTGGVRSVGVSTGSGNNTITLHSLPVQIPVQLTGGTGSNTLVGPNAATTWSITATNAGKVGNLSFSGIANLQGGTGVDTFKFSDGQGVTGTIRGGGAPAGQGDWLNYAAYKVAHPVTVNLATGTATGVAGGVSGIPNVIGGQGNDTLTGSGQGNILVGGGGSDTITGGGGRSLLIGGAGADKVTGGSGDDIVVTGTTKFDANTTALMAILREWQRTDKDYLGRIADLRTGGAGTLNGSNKLIFGPAGTSGSTVFDDGTAGDVLSGGAGLDWFFQGAGDTVTDLQSGEKVNNRP
jgi:hypothetical protein